MSYARWGSHGNWYAFVCGLDAKPELALWHCGANDAPSWTLDDLQDADAGWIKARYSVADDNDVAEALEIIRMFKDDFVGETDKARKGKEREHGQR
jgi:hypothetical protein